MDASEPASACFRMTSATSLKCGLPGEKLHKRQRKPVEHARRLFCRERNHDPSVSSKPDMLKATYEKNRLRTGVSIFGPHSKAQSASCFGTLVRMPEDVRHQAHHEQGKREIDPDCDFQIGNQSLP